MITNLKNKSELSFFFPLVLCQTSSPPTARYTQSDCSTWGSADPWITVHSESVDSREDKGRGGSFRSHWSAGPLPNFCICFHFYTEDAEDVEPSSSCPSGGGKFAVVVLIKTSSSAGGAGNVIWGSFTELDCVGFTWTLVSLGLGCITTSHWKATPILTKFFLSFHPLSFLPPLWKPSCHCVALMLHATPRSCLFLPEITWFIH